MPSSIASDDEGLEDSGVCGGGSSYRRAAAWRQANIYDYIAERRCGVERYRVKPGVQVKLAEWDPSDYSEFDEGKKKGKAKLDELTDQLEELQELLYAEGKHKLLVVLQGTDTAGKDGVIRHVFDGVNPQGVKVASFKVPTPQELSRITCGAFISTRPPAARS